MTLVLMEGWDHADSTTKFASKGWAFVRSNIAVNAGRFGGWALGAIVNGGAVKGLPSTYTTLIVGFAFKAERPFSEGAGCILRLWTSAAQTTQVASVWINAVGKIEVRNSSNTVIATGTTTILPLVYHYYELKIFVNGASGTCELHLDGLSSTPEIASTTGNFGSTAIGAVDLFSSLPTASGLLSWDDVYAVSTSGSAPQNTFLGDVRAVTLYPNADGAHSAWTPNSGSTHYNRVNESSGTWPDDDTTYLSDATPGDYDTWAFTDIDANATIYGIQQNVYARKDDAALRQIAPVVRKSGTDYDQATVTLISTYAYYSAIQQQDPTAADWTPTSLNAAEFGVKEIA